MKNLSRHISIIPEQAAFLIIDVQNLSCSKKSSDFKGYSSKELKQKYGYYFDNLENRVLPNIRLIQDHCRKKKIEVIFTVIENLTQDGRDRSLDYKITPINVPKGNFEAQIPKSVAPVKDEVVMPKTSSSVFNSTNIDYVLRNLGIKFLIIAGLLADQCVESAVRDACDLGYLVSLVQDACSTYSESRHQHSLNSVKGYCRQINTEDLIQEIQKSQNNFQTGDI